MVLGECVNRDYYSFSIHRLTRNAKSSLLPLEVDVECISNVRSLMYTKLFKVKDNNNLQL